MAGSVRIDAKYYEMLKDFTNKENGNKIFESYKDLAVFAASIGFHFGKRLLLGKTMQDPIKMHIFNDEYDIELMNCIALAETENPLLLGNKKEEQKINIFEEYISGGLEIIKNRIYDQSSDWEQNLISLILEQNKNKEDFIDDLIKDLDFI